MKRKVKAGRFTAAAIAVGAALLPVFLLHSRPELLKRARFVATGVQWQHPEDYFWLSDRTLFCQRSRPYTEVSRTPTSYKILASFEAGPYYFDALSKTVTRDAALKAKLGREQFRLQTSPNGQWLMADLTERDYGWSSDPMQKSYTVCRRDGSGVFKQPVGNGFIDQMWCADSQNWLIFSGKHVAPSGSPAGINMNEQPMKIQRVTIGSVDAPGSVRTIEVPPAGLLRKQYQHIFALTPDRLLIYFGSPYSYSGGVIPWQQAIVQEIGLQSTHPIRQYTLTPPGERGIIQLVCSPKGDRIAWKLQETVKPSALQTFLWEHLHMGDPYTSNICRVSLWVSRADGSEMREVGVMPPTLAPLSLSGSAEFDPETGENLWGASVPRLIRWTPDGKTISFTFKDNLYTVPAD